MPAVGISKFGAPSKGHSNFKQITEAINRSPLLVDLINCFPRKIILGKPEAGCFFSRQKQRINIDENWVNKIASRQIRPKLSWQIL